MERPIDLRRDTITLPTEAMKQFAFQAELGDSIYGEDPMQRKLEELGASILGKERAIFLPSGTMGNLVALLTHTRRGEEVILEESAHIFTSETGGVGAIAGLTVKPIRGEDGAPSPAAILQAIRPDNIHYPRTRLICLENTHYRYGGIVPPLEKFRAIRELATEKGLSIHLDGARLFNAAVYLGVEVQVIAQYADTVMVSLSKGLGAPVGSLLAGPRDFIKEAERYRKMLGGGMRQTGWLCACGIMALSPENIARLREDHENARFLAEGLCAIPGIKVDCTRVHTNFVLADLAESGWDARQFVERLKEKGVLATPAGESKVRFVTSKEVNRTQIALALERIHELMRAR
ncbi:MAG: aminotransferase class I/II-fold pyridoxal phosphate-dependent enzyme [Candidatus Atribacteria bacterium]|nr:aminotransferase class I/II-fold pyridoxal phosphate-dependent enzyme [Candidatus Atribacteria bacterium]